jgi:hypothetical protein
MSITSYKGFNADMTCRGFQFEIGGTYTHEGEVAACASGFHACEYPLDVLGYYAPATSVFAEVIQSGQVARHSEDSKIASRVLHVKASLSLSGLVKAAIDYTFSRSTLEGVSATGDRGAASATGARGAASATGYQGAASATGLQGAASATGYQGAASATGAQGAASATGYQGAASATGLQGAASATGYQGAASATGDRGAASATGARGAASATGYQGAASATGDRGAASATGAQGAASATGTGGRVKGAIGSALFLVERDINGTIISVGSAIVGQKGVLPDVWYTLKDGEFVSVDVS